MAELTIKQRAIALEEQYIQSDDTTLAEFFEAIIHDNSAEVTIKELRDRVAALEDALRGVLHAAECQVGIPLSGQYQGDTEIKASIQKARALLSTSKDTQGEDL